MANIYFTEDIGFRMFFVVFTFLFISINQSYASDFKNKENTKFYNLQFKQQFFNQDVKYFHKNLVQVKIKEEFYHDDFLEIIINNNELKCYLEYIEVKSIDKPYNFYKKDNNNTTENVPVFDRVFQIAYVNPIDVVTVSNNLASYQEIEYACPLIIRNFDFIPNDSLWVYQNELRAIKAEQAYEITMGDTSIIIALVDAEYDWMHEDLTDNIFVNKAEIPDNKIDDDGNGFIDDVCGWDFLSNTTYTDFTFGKIKEDNNTRMDDIDTKLAHGTLIGGCASARTNNRIGMASTAPYCKLLPVKISSDLGFSGNEHKGALYASMMGADIINCSWNYLGYSQIEKEIVESISNSGSLFVNSAGNNALNIDDEHYRYENSLNVLYVGASDNDDNLAHFTNFGVLTGIYAPGSEINGCKPGNRYTIGSGTSFSAPLVSGAAALVKSLHKDWLPRQIYHQLRATADRIFYDNDSPYQKLALGRLNILKALEYNIRFDSGKTLPGLEITKVMIDKENGRLNLVDTAKISLSMKNWLADAKNIKIEFTSIDERVAFETSSFFIESIATLDEKNIVISIYPTETARWYDVESRIAVKFSSDDYVNYQLLKIPLDLYLNEEKKLIPTFTGFHNKSNDFNWLLVENISSNEINSVWGTGIRSDYKTFFFVYCAEKPLFYDTIAGLHDYGNRIKTKVIAAGANSAYLLATHRDFVKRGQLMQTFNYGRSWQTINLPNDALALSDFATAGQGKLVIMSEGGIIQELYTSINNGKNWSKCSNIAIQNGEELLRESLFAMDKNIMIGSTKGRIYYSSDFGNKWQYSQFDTNLSIRSIYSSKFVDGIAILMDINRAYFAYNKNNTYNKNNSWEIDTSYDAMQMVSYPKIISETMNPHSFLVGGDKIAFFNHTSRQWQYRLIDSLDIQRMATSNWASMSSGMHTRVWILSDSLKYIDIGEKPQEQKLKSKELLYFNVYPNPASEYFDVQTYFIKSEAVEIAMFNSTGKQIGDAVKYFSKANSFETFRINGSKLAQGIYYIRLSTKNETFLRNIALIK